MIRVHLGGHLDWYDAHKRAWLEVSTQGPIALLALTQRLGIPASEIAIVMVNQRIADLEMESVQDGDTVEFFPAVGGG